MIIDAIIITAAIAAISRIFYAINTDRSITGITR